jgi:serine phosphatase RsbU (regulator of sigma subunit)
MAELRYSLRAFAGVDVPADEILRRLNAMLIDSGKELTATVCLVTVDTAAMTIEVHNAGHPPPILSDDAGTRFLDQHGLLLGLRNRPERDPMRVAICPNAVLVLATDGLLERRDEDIQLGMERMRNVVAGHEGDAHDLVERLIDELTTDDAIDDDIAVVAARHRAAGDGR